jgi:hypothetical protein
MKHTLLNHSVVVEAIDCRTERGISEESSIDENQIA